MQPVLAKCELLQDRFCVGFTEKLVNSDLLSAIESQTSFSSTAVKTEVIDGMRWLGLSSDEPAKLCHTPLDTLCAKLEAKLKYARGERDMVILEHHFETEHQNGNIVFKYLPNCIWA